RYVSVLNDTAVRPWALRGPEPGRSSPIPRDNALTGLCALILINAPLAGAADDASHPQEDREVSTVQGTYNDKVVRQFAVMTVVWGIVGMLVGVIIAAQLYWPALNFDLPWFSYGRLRPLHTNAVIFAFGGCALMAT